MDDLNVNQAPQTTESVDTLKLHNTKPQKTAADWVRDMRMSAAVNKFNTGVETDQVTPDLLLATSKKLLGISKREQEPDPKDSLAFQRFYGPEMLFQERILRDGGKLARNILWKATNRGNLDFMPVGALDKHISSVFYDSKLAQMMDGSSPLETIDAAYKTTRIGEGGVASQDSAPDEMRTVQPSYFGFIDPVRCFAKGTEIKTENGWKAIEDITTDDKVLTWVNGKSEYVNPTEVMTFDYADEMIGYNDGTVAFLVTPHHRMWIHWDDTDSWRYAFAEDVAGCTIMIDISDNDTPEPYVLTEEDWYKITNKPYGKVHCLTVSGGLIYCKYLQQQGFRCGQSPESFRVGLDVYMTKNVMKGTDGKLYQKFIDAKTGKEVLLDSETAANSVIASSEMRDAKTKDIFALGGPTGVRIVPKSSVQYYLPRADEAYSTASNLVTMLSGVKEMRLQMGCLHPDTNVLTISKKNLITVQKAQVTKDGSIPGSTENGLAAVYPIRTTVAKFPPKRNWFYKIILKSGRSLITSADHRWSVLRNNRYRLIDAKDLKPGDMALRSTFKDVISRRTFVNGMLVNKDLATVFGYIARSLSQPDSCKMRISCPEERYNFVMQQLARIGFTEGFNTYYMNVGTFCIGIRDDKFKMFLKEAFGATDRDRKIPDFIMSANATIVSAFLDGYTTDPTKMGRDSADDIWVLDIPNTAVRDSLAFLFARIETDTLYRDTTVDGEMEIAMKLVPMDPRYGDMILDEIKVVKKGISAPIMVDIDINDNLYAVANGIVTHNSKYPLQAISVENREAPLVRGLDEASGKDMQTLIGKYLGARFAPQDGVVTAVRKDRIDVQYADGSKGKVDLYVNFPMNAKGYINNTPVVKAGQAFKKGDCLAASNYTDDKGVAALGTNLRSAWMSWKGGTYEDAIVISESAAKKLTSTTMYKTAVDLDKTVKLGKKNYVTWKPGEFSKEQMEMLDDNGIVKPGTILHKEDPMILAVRMSEPSPGTLGKRILTDMSERWEHDHPGVVTDVVKTRNGIKVYATVTAPVEIGDKLSNKYGAKGTCAQIIPDDEMPQDSKGRPYEILFSPLSIISRTNPSQVFEAQLGKVAAKTGKPIVVPQFFKGSIADFVEDQLKQNHLKADEDLTDPTTGRIMKDVTTGVSYIYKLKHLAESKLSARGTSSYDAEGVPGGKGMDGCFPGPQLIQTDGEFKTISALAFSKDVNQVGTCDEKGNFCYYPSIDSFRKLVKPEDLITIVPKWSFGPKGYLAHSIITMSPTKNHAIYMYNGMIQKHAADIKVGDKIAGMGRRPSDDQMQVLANLISTAGVLDEDDRLTITYDDDHAALASFKCGILRPVYVNINEKKKTLTVLHYSLYEAALQEQDFGELYQALQMLDGHGTDDDAELIAKHIPWSVIPDNKAELRDAVKDIQDMTPVRQLETKTHMGLMPIVVEDIVPYKTDKERIKVYDLTIDTTHRYILQGGFIVSNSKRFGTLEQSALAGHGVFNGVIKDAKYIRGQSNSDFWRSLRTGDIPTVPGEPLVHKKFFASLTGAGVNVKKTPKGVSIFALTNKDVEELAGPREVKSRDTYEARTFRPIDDGLFGQNVFGINGDKWGYIQLDEPVPNPVMEEPLARLLNIPEKKFADVAAGKEEVNGIRGGVAMKKALEKLDLAAESVRALNNFKTMSPSGKDKALKRYRSIEQMRRAGVNPADYMLDRVPVIPPIYRPITSHNGLTMVADSNYLYAQLLDARDDARDAAGLPDEYKEQARENIYNKWKELTGIYAPQDVKLQSKHVQGLLKWALGSGSPKFSAFSRKVLSATVDTVGRGVITPDPRLKLNQVGLPQTMAFNIMGPMVERKLVKQGYTPVQAMEKVKKQDLQARDALNEVMEDHPVLINRAPTLHKLSILGLHPKLVAGNAIRINPSIVSTLAADFDGDTISGEWSVEFDLKEIEENREKLEKSGKKFLTSPKCVLHYMQGTNSGADFAHINGKEQDMFSKSAKARFTAAICSPAELPVVPGSEKQISKNVIEWDVIPGVYTDTMNLDGSRVLAPVTKISKHTGLKMFEVTTSVSGKYSSVITASEDHSLIAIDLETLELEKVRPEDAVGRLIPRLRRDQSTTHETCQRYIQFDKLYEADYDLGLFIGMMIGDGWVSGHNQSLIACCDESLQKEILRLVDINNTKLPVLSQTKVSYYAADPQRFSQEDKGRIDLHLEGAFKTALKDMIGTGAYYKRIPAQCLRASKAHRLGILMGLLATDGCVNYSEGTTAKKSKSKSIIYHTTSTELRDGLSYLCQSLGIRTSVTPYMGKHSKETCYAVCLSIVDVAREVSHNPTLFRVPCDKKQAALEKICADINSHGATCCSVTDIVPFPAALSEELTWAKTANATSLCDWRKRGYIGLDRAKRLAADLRNLDWSTFVAPKNYPEDLRRHHTPKQAKELVDAWCDIVEASDFLAWVHVDSVTPSTCTEGWDCTVPGPYTFSLYDGTIVQDTVNIHAPVSDDARKEAYAKMMPERNLIGMRSREILYKPEKEYQQGLYIATRMKQGADVRTHYFNTLEEAKQAYRDGLIDVDDPIVIKDK